MPDVFLPGPFAERDLQDAILGAGGRVELTAARLPGHALTVDPRGATLVLAADPAAAAPGALGRAGPDAAARLAFALTAMGGGAGPRPVETTAGPAVAHVAAPAAARAPWPAAPQPEWRAHLAEAAAEVMAHFGRRPAEDVAAGLPGVSYRALARVRGRAGAGPARLRRASAAADVEPLALERPYLGYFSIEEHRLRHRRFDGGMSAEVARAVFTSGDAVTVLPFDARRRRVLVVEQFRVGPYARRDPQPWCIEAVAGRCDAGEGPEATARREAREEAALELGRMERIAGYYTSPGTMAELITAYVGEADLEGAGGVHGLAEEHEDIRVLVLPLAEAMALAASGEVNNGPLLISLLWLDAHAARLARAWAG